MHTEKVQTYTLFGLLGITSVLTFLIFKPFLIPVALAAIFAIVLYPLYQGLLIRLSLWRGFAAFITIVIAVVGLVAPLTFISLKVINEAQQTYTSLTQGAGLATTQITVIGLGNSLEPSFPGAAATAKNISANLDSYVEQGLGWILRHLGNAASRILGLSIDLIIFLAGLYVFLRNGPRIRERLVHLSPFNDADDNRIFDTLSLTVNSVVRGSLAVALLQGIVAGIGYLIFGVPNPMLWGLLTGIAALIPGVGTMLVLVPAIAYLFIVGSTLPALGLLLWGMTAVGLLDNFLGPVLMSKGVHLPALVILLSVLGGVAFFGPAGIFLGPLTVSFLVALFELYSHGGSGKTPSTEA